VRNHRDASPAGFNDDDPFALRIGERILIPCVGGPSSSRLEHFPPPVEVWERGGLYVLVDDGASADWHYVFVPNQPFSSA
jgi:hypothetical protein